MARKNKSQNSRSRKQQNQPKVIVKTVKVPQQMGIGAQLGDKLQKFAESTFSRLVGKGDYALQDNIDQMKKNSLFTDGAKKSIKFGNNNCSVVVEHSEFIGHIVSSETIGDYSVDVFPCDPVNPTTFPWLSDIATNFEQYEFEGLVFRIESLSGFAVSGSDSSLGSISTVFMYDPTNATPTNKQQILQAYGSNTSSVARSQLVGVECDKSSQVFDKLYIREDDASSEQRFYSKGNFVVATQGLKAAAQTVCELWVHYKVRLMFPKQTTSVTSLTDIAYITNTSADHSHMLDPETSISYSNSLNLVTITDSTAYVWGLQADMYYMVCSKTTYTNTANVNVSPIKLTGAVSTAWNTLGSASVLVPGSGTFYTYWIGKVTSSVNNLVILDVADLIGAGSTVTSTNEYRIYPLPNFDGTQWSDINKLAF